MSTRSIAEINARLERGEAVVMSAMEFKSEVRKGRRFRLGDVDVVTTATRAVMSGTSATLAIPALADADVRRVWLNGVPCTIAGAGSTEVVIYGTAESRDYPRGYGGGHVLRDLVEGRALELACEYADGRTSHRRVGLAEMPFARMYSFRNDYQNYTAFANFRNQRSYRENPTSIFAGRPLPPLKALTMSGSGELNPLANDPGARAMRIGMKILVNKVPGVIIGYGTRSSGRTRNLSVAADLRGMDPEYMGGFKTSAGMEVTNSLAIPIPVLSDEILDDLARCLDENLPLPFADLADRIPLGEIRYADIWKGAALWVDFDPARCICCSFQCPAEYYCPMGAISWREKRIEQGLCVACGACTSNCPGGAFSGRGRAPEGRIGAVNIDGETIPVVFRQSNRRRSEELAAYLKEQMLGGRFQLTDSSLQLKREDA
ncbi:MAG: 4Fe-4S binding protein [Betaproteobacteria bacterium]|nr:4Fe-4S binding protein [Betaproteobacteria bacterium]